MVIKRAKKIQIREIIVTSEVRGKKDRIFDVEFEELGTVLYQFGGQGYFWNLNLTPERGRCSDGPLAALHATTSRARG
jgi:hypothetical protein